MSEVREDQHGLAGAQGEGQPDNATSPGLAPVFVYGALMSGGPKMVEGQAAWVQDHAVRFVARGVPLLEPAFAALVPEQGQTAQGVLWHVDEATRAKMRAQEDGYREERLLVETAAGSVFAHAFILTQEERLQRERLPSARYLRLLADGARQFGLSCADDYAARAEGASRLSLLFFRLKPLVVSLTPHLGLGPSIVLLLVALLAPLLVLLWLFSHLVLANS